MQSIINDIQADIRNFISDSHQQFLIVSCEMEHSALLFKTIDALDQDNDFADIILTVFNPFNAQTEFVNDTLLLVKQQVAQLNEDLEKRGESLFPPFPEELEQKSLPPLEKLIGAIEYIESGVPIDRRVIWILFPSEINDAEKYSAIIEKLSGRFQTRTKFIVRDDMASSLPSSKFESEPSAILYNPKLDPESFEKRLIEKSTDKSLPADERAQIHMMLAGYDIANRRYDQALARNRELLSYFSLMNQPHKETIVMNNIGDLFYMQKRWVDAQAWYQRAVSLSVKIKSQPLVMYQCMNLGNTFMVQKKYSEALTYFRSVEQMAAATGPITQQIQALERIGQTCYSSKKYDEAIEAYTKAAALNEKVFNEEGRNKNLEQIQKIRSLKK